MKQTENNGHLLSEAQAADILGLKNPKTLAVWRCTQRYDLPYVKYGRVVRYRRKDLDAFIEAKMVNTFKPGGG
jgi:hypothetical protein